MKSATGKQSRQYSPKELLALADDAEERKASVWVTRELRNQAHSQFFPNVRE